MDHLLLYKSHGFYKFGKFKCICFIGCKNLNVIPQAPSVLFIVLENMIIFLITFLMKTVHMEIKVIVFCLYSLYIYYIQVHLNKLECREKVIFFL